MCRYGLHSCFRRLGMSPSRALMRIRRGSELIYVYDKDLAMHVLLPTPPSAPIGEGALQVLADTRCRFALRRPRRLAMHAEGSGTWSSRSAVMAVHRTLCVG